MRPIHQILYRPLLTEKSVRNTQGKKYTFAVALDANKIEIARAVEAHYASEKIKVASVNTMHMRGRERKVTMKRGRRPSTGLTPRWKKAVVTLTHDSPTIPQLEGA